MLHRIRKKHDVNKDKWIGIGGHFEGIESPEECLLREAKEETGLTLTSYRFRGLVTFIPDETTSEYMCLYTADGWEGEMTDCKEGKLEWVEKKPDWKFKPLGRRSDFYETVKRKCPVLFPETPL